MVYDQMDRRRSTLGVLNRISAGTLGLGDQIGVVDAEGTREVVSNDYILYHLSADASIVAIRNTTAGSIMYKFDEVNGISNDGRGLVLVEPVFQLAIRDKLNMEGKPYAEDLVTVDRRRNAFERFTGRLTGR